MSSEFPAIVCYPPNPLPDWRIEKLRLKRQPSKYELKVRMVATGICHTDLIYAQISPGINGAQYPRVLGHEGAGIVDAVGEGVTVAKVGDRVLLSYNYCGSCDLCDQSQESYCISWRPLNTVAQDGVFETSSGPKEVHGKFFGQSSFAAMAMVSENCVVNVDDIIRDNEELKLMAPLGCGLMTGFGAVHNAAKARPCDIILVVGLGAVGLGAVMAGKVAGCKEIIAVDRVKSRLQLAKELGATRSIDTSLEGVQLSRDARKAVNDQRISYVVETTGTPSIIEDAMIAMGKRGRLLQIGVPKAESQLVIHLNDFFRENKVLECHFLGECTGQFMIPKMIEWYHQGKLPIDKMVKFFAASNILQAVREMELGAVVKPIITW
ncbi:hypothetical protein H2198_010017 [Neophaeococcomyces mojaviensis]|uniref:Uncharacterized protein n=1 Tax=Neophaeococcomyces mojaviensis TaxID=3383035 RepID=A0ACC2ZT44_9EURO|nr:hypothetical protein H2198_010017 [Knufia sp. JES_112]